KLRKLASLVQSKYGEFLYKHLILFPSVEEFGGSLSVEAITDFVDNGGYVLVAGRSNPRDALMELAFKCEFEVDEENAAVIDHLNYDISGSEDHTLVGASPENLINSEIVIGKKSVGPLLYRGTGLLADMENPLVLLRVVFTDCSYVPDAPINEYPHTRTLLIAALQARNNATVVFSGSLYFFSVSTVQRAQDENLHNKSDNQDMATFISKWVFGGNGVRVRSDKHLKTRLERKKIPPVAYTITEPVVNETLAADGKWQPFQVNDIQLEFVRIDPFVRTTLSHIGGGRFRPYSRSPMCMASKFKVDYDRIGYAHLYSTTQVSVQPPTLTQYERFIPAYPYYVSTYSMMVGNAFFSFLR
ncbi:AAEL003468-PA, partial [Aedes aegypti]